MQNRISRPLNWAVVILVCFAIGAVAAPNTYNFTLTDVTWNSSMGGVYTSPYYATITDSGGNIVGVGLAVICDDFATESYLHSTFTATATSVADLTGQSTVKFDQGNATQQQTDYATAAFLVGQILAEGAQTTAASQHTAEILSFALWSLFDPPALGSLNATNAAAASEALAYAQAHALSYSQYANVMIWTPSPDQSVSQEFLTFNVGMDEPYAPAILAVDLLAVIGLMVVFRRRITGLFN